MITLFTGPDRLKGLRDWALLDPTTLWIDLGGTGDSSLTCITASYQALAAYAARARFPDRKPEELRVTDLDSLFAEKPTRRAPTLTDYQDAPHLLRLAGFIACGKPHPMRIALSNLSWLYDQVLARVAACHDPALVKAYGRALAREALMHLVCDLRDAGIELGATVDQIAVGKQLLLNLPEAILPLAHLVER